jgi:hypothetical protein
MRVRDAIWREIVRSYTLWLIVVALVFVGLGLLPDDFSRLFWIPIAILVCSIPCGILVARSICPQCAFQFHDIGFRLVRGNPQRRIDRCPGCHLDLDTEISEVTPRPPAASPPMIHTPFLLGFGMVMVPAVVYLTNQDPEPLGAEPALVLLGSLGAAGATFAFHRSARDRRFPSLLVAPVCGAVSAVVFYSALGLLYHGLSLYSALFSALVLAVLAAWICPRRFGVGTA